MKTYYKNKDKIDMTIGFLLGSSVSIFMWVWAFADCFQKLKHL